MALLEYSQPTQMMECVAQTIVFALLDVKQNKGILYAIMKNQIGCKHDSTSILSQNTVGSAEQEIWSLLSIDCN